MKYVKMTSCLFYILSFISAFAANTALSAEEKPISGLVGAWYGRSDLTNVQTADLISTLDLNWNTEKNRESDWSAKWEGSILAPTTGDVTFHVQTDHRVQLLIDGKPVVEIEKGRGSGSGLAQMVQDKAYTITVIYRQTGSEDGYQRVLWSWSGHEKSAIPEKNLQHTKAQEEYWNWRPQAMPEKSRWSAYPVTHVFVFKEAGRFGGWPSNNGIWSWGNEILVGFEMGYYKENTEGDHSFDRDKPKLNVLARSLDGGQSWSIEDPENYVGDGGKIRPLTSSIQFNHPDFAMRVGGDNFNISYTRGKTWEGPYELPKFGQENLTSRTDYIVNGPKDCHLFLSTFSKDVHAGLQDRSFCAQTIDGGKSFQFLSWMTGEPIIVRSVMSSTVRISENHLVSAMRRRLDLSYPDRPSFNENWIDAYQSKDNGKSWEFLSKVANTDLGDRNGNPPTLLRLKDGRLCLAYGYRAEPYGIRVKLSKDDGKTWGDAISLRDDGGTWDLGYTRMVQRPDGKIVTIYYYNTEEIPEQHIVATIWDPDQIKP